MQGARKPKVGMLRSTGRVERQPVQGRWTGTVLQLCHRLPARFGASLSLWVSISLGVQPGHQLCPALQRAAVVYREVSLGRLDLSSVPRPSCLARHCSVTSTLDLKCSRKHRKPQELSRAEQQPGVPNFGEAAGPCLSRQCHLLPLHTRPRPRLRHWGRGQQRPPRVLNHLQGCFPSFKLLPTSTQSPACRPVHFGRSSMHRRLVWLGTQSAPQEVPPATTLPSQTPPYLFPQ